MLLNEAENRAADKFAMEHYERHAETAEVFIHAKQTGLGYGIEVRCPHCGEKKNITDSSHW